MNSLDGKAVSKLRLQSMIVILGAAYFLSNFHRLSFGVLGETIATDFSLNPTELGLIGAALYYTYAAMQLPSGIVTDFVSPKKLIAAACLLTGISTVCLSVAGSFSSLLISRAATGLAVAFVYVPALSTLRQWFGDKSLGRMAGILVAMGQMGAVFAAAPLKYVSDLIGWKSVFLVIGVLSIALSAVVLLVVPDKECGAPQGESGSNKKDLGVLLTPAFIALVVWFFISGGTRFAFQGLWGAAFYTRVLSLTATQSGVLLLWVSVGCICGAMVLGYLSDLMGSLKSVVLSGVALTVVWLALLLVTADTPTWVIYFLSISLGVFGAGGFTVGFTCIRNFASRNNTGILTGVINCAAFMGSAIFTQATGNFMTAMMEKQTMAQSFNLLFMVFTALCLVSTLAVFILMRTAVQVSR